MKEEEILERVMGWRRDPVRWVEDMFGLVPQPLKAGYTVEKSTELEEIRSSWFEEFEKGRHITWQQWVILLAVKRGLEGGKRFISVASGRGIGKSNIMAVILLWFLINYEDSQIPCTAPKVEQMYDVLWKEVNLWARRLPESFRELLELQSSYIRVKQNPTGWFARASTARKENPEALAGVHSDNTMLMVDEGSGVPEEIFLSGEGVLTNKNMFFLIFSNYTRLTGYFHKTQINEFGEWQTLSFSSADSPIVQKGYLERTIRRGEDSNEYRVMVLGKPPKAGEEINGYVPLLQKSDLRFTLMDGLMKPVVLGIDPSGSGRNKSAFVVRDPFRAVPVGVYQDMRSAAMAQHTLRLMEEYRILPENVIVDGFGVGVELINEFSKLGVPIMGVLVGQPADDPLRYYNKKSEIYWRLREWILRGNELVGTYKQWEEILGIRYGSELSKVKIMGKKRMLDIGLKSPDLIEALSLTFCKEYYSTDEQEKETLVPEHFDKFYGI
jgi:hypothetical protein